MSKEDDNPGLGIDDEVIASDVIKSNTLQYAKHILANHFPSPIDGLKRVRRRIVYKQPTDGWFGGSHLISNTIAIHPYGDMSIYDAATSMVNTFESTFPLIAIHGKGGSYNGKRAASARYVKFKLTDFCKEIFFNDINFKTIPTEPTEDLQGREIKYFIPKIPTALLYENESIGFGYSSRTVPMKFENICDIVIDFVTCPDKLKWDYSKLAKLFVPCFPIKVRMMNIPELHEEYKKGNFTHPIKTEGIYTITSNCSVLFRTLAYGISPKAIRESIKNANKDKDHWMTKADIMFKALSANHNYIDFEFTTKRGANIFTFIDNVKGLLRIRTPAHVIDNFVFDYGMMNLTPPTVVQMWYKERYRSILGTKKHRQQDIQTQRMRLQTYLIICGHVDEVINIIKTLDLENIRKALKDRFGLSIRQCDVLLTANLQILMKSKKPEIEDRLIKIEKDLADLNESFRHIDNEIFTEVKVLKKKFKTETEYVSFESKYVGCLIVGELGIMQVDNVSEVLYTAAMFNGINVRFLPYHSGIKSIKFHNQTITYYHTAELPFTINSLGIGVQYKMKTHIFIRDNKKSRCIINSGNLIIADRSIVSYITRKAMVVTSGGKITSAPDELFEGRKQASNVLYAFDATSDGDHVVISVNAAHPNVIRLQKVTLGKTKVLFSGAGESVVVDVVPIETGSVVVNLPKFHKYSVMFINDIAKYVAKDIVNDINIRSITKA